MAEPEILGARALPCVDRLREDAEVIVHLHNALTRLLATVNVRDAESHAANCGCVIHEARAALAEARGDV